MLASSFLSAEQLGLTSQERDALLDVLGRLERGELKHVSDEDRLHDDRHSITIVGFNMGTWNCGSVHCIGGWADRLHGTEFSLRADEYAEDCPQLHELFFAEEATEPWFELEDITVSQAAEALRNYLTTGDAQWEKVVCGW